MKTITQISVGWMLLSVILFHAIPLMGQKLTYKSSTIGNTYYKLTGSPGPHMQNNINDMNVDIDGGCVTWASWDEGGQAASTYKNGTYIGAARYRANSYVAKDKNGKTWTIKNPFGRFQNGQPSAGGIAYAGTDYDKFSFPPPTGANAPYILCSDGRKITEIADPLSVGINWKTGELMVGDNTIAQNIKIYDVNDTARILKHVRTFGIEGGVWAGTNPGLMDDPLKFAGIAGLGADSSGIIYVATSVIAKGGGSGGGADLRAFYPDGTLKWNLLGVLFLTSGCVDPSSNGTDIYNPYFHFRMDYSKPVGQDWKIVATNINTFKYTDDIRILQGGMSDGCCIKVVNGRKYFFVSDQYLNALAVYRMDGEIAVPCAAFCVSYGWNGDEHIRFNYHWARNRPAMPRWLWCDRNNNAYGDDNEFETYNTGQFVNALDIDDEGSVYLGSDNGLVYKFPTNGFDTAGNPKYSAASMVEVGNVGHAVHTMKWIKETDMFICGDNYSIKNVDVYKDWSKPTRKKLYTAVLPTANNECYITADKDYFYVSYSVTAGPKTGKEGETDVYKMIDGSFVGYIIPGPEVGGASGWIDMKQPTKVFVTNSGMRIITCEEDWAGHIFVYQWCPTGDCSKTCTTKVDSIKISPENITLIGLQTDTLTYKIYPDTVCYKEVAWFSSDTSIVKTDYYGHITSVNPGSAWIKVVSDQQPDISDSIQVSVANVAVAGIFFKPDTAVLKIGYTKQFSVNFLPVNALNRKLSWKSSDSTIASVDSTGKIKGIAKGSIIIIATSEDGGFSDTCFLNVIPIPVIGVKMSLKTITTWVGESMQLKGIISPVDANINKLKWTSSDTAIAKVDSAGLVTGVALGTSRVTVTTVDGGFSDTCQVKVVSADQFADLDIGTVCVHGSLALSGNTFNVTAGGADIWNAEDEFHFVYKSLDGNGGIIAKVVSMANTNEWAKAGLMMRESLDPSAFFADMVVTPGSGTSFQLRDSLHMACDNTTPNNGKKAPYWLNLKRIGNVFTGYSSADGNVWTMIGSSTMKFNSKLLVGLCLTSHNDCVLGAATFGNVVISGNIDTVKFSTPVATITAPKPNATAHPGDVVAFTATATNTGGIISKVEMLVNDSLLTTIVGAPYTFNYVPSTAGAKTLKVKAYDDKGNISIATINIVVSLLINAIEENSIIDQITVYPNPLGGNSLTISGLKDGKARVDIEDMSGRSVFSTERFTSGSIRIDDMNLNQGIYILRIRNNEVFTNKKLVVK